MELHSTRKIFYVLLALLFFASTKSHAQKDELTQFSIIDALLSGVYEGSTTLDDLKQYGDFGLGTFNRLDGEMILFEGNVYKVRYDGKVIKENDNEKTPFAVAVKFNPDSENYFEGPLTMQQLTAKIDSLIASPNYFYAVKINGKFTAMQTRSVPEQDKPYRPLAEVVKNQSVFNFENIGGTIIGFRCPPFAKGVNVPGYHFHFLSDDLKSGGHVLDFRVTDCRVFVDVKSSFKVLLPGDEEFKVRNFSSDRESDLIKAEKK